MRILQVVTYISPDGAYGGPVRVALNQAKSLSALGHQVIVAAAAGGFHGSLPKEFDGFPVKLIQGVQVLPGTGFAGMASPGLLAWLAKAVKDADVVHVHMARDLITIPSAALAVLFKKPLIVQTHGMIDKTDKVLAQPLDKLATKPLLRSANAVLYLTSREQSHLVELVGSQLNFKYMPNGVPVSRTRAIEQTMGSVENPEVLYLARLHARKRPLYFVKAARTLATKHPKASFTLYGPDEGEGFRVKSEIQESGIADRLAWYGSLPPSQTLTRMARASIYALPSRDEPFPMSVLEAMSLGLPVIVTQSCGLAPTILEAGAGLVCEDTESSFIGAVNELLQDSDMRIGMGANAREAVANHFSMANISSKLASAYEEAVVDKL